jgi:hypothetical protein
MGGVPDVYLSRHEVAMVTSDGTLWRQDVDTLEAGLRTLVDRLSEAKSARSVRVWLGGALCRPVRVAPIANVRSRQERDRLWQLAVVSESGLPAPCRVQVDALGAASAVAAVVEEHTLGAIARAFAARHVRVASVRPWWAQALAAALRANTALRAFGAWEGRALTTFMGQGGAFSLAHTVHPIDTAASASAAFARQQVSAFVAAEDAVAVALDLTAMARESETGDGVAFAPWITRLGASS